MIVKIVTDSTSYINRELQEQLDITVIPLSVQFPDESFQETEVDYAYFYSKIAKTGIIPTSSQPPQSEFESVFRNLLAAGHQVLGIFISSLMSGTYESALVARARIIEDDPGAAIEILDSRTNCMALGSMALAGAREAARGSSLLQVKNAIEAIMPRIRFYFVPATLEYLKKGGRIGGASALLGSLLQIKPVLYVREGETELLERVRGKRAAIARMLEIMDDDASRLGLSEVVIHHIDAPAEAAELGRNVESRFGLPATFCPIGPVIGLHVGPGTLGLVYITENS
ncbi:MAG: DegV family protein [Syntrophomonadaceae bacterium]